MDKCQKFSLICLVIVTISAISSTHAEVYTAIVDMEPLLDTHKRIIDDLDHYVAKEEKRISALKKHLTHFKKEHSKAMEDIPNYLGNPINAFTLIKRLTRDLDHIEATINVGTEYVKNITVNHADVTYPSSEDVVAAAQALIRLQNTYQLDVTQLADGLLNGISYSSPLRTSDLYELAKSLYQTEDYHNAQMWMLEALRKYREGDHDDLDAFTEADILEYISFSHYLQGDVETALEWTERLLTVAPQHPRAAHNVPHYRKAIQQRIEDASKKPEPEEEPPKVESDAPPRAQRQNSWWQPSERSHYEMLCRGDVALPPSVTKHLRCRYMSETHPFLLLAPLKEEQMYSQPDVFVYHQVMSDEEIQLVKELAVPRLKRALVHSPETGELVPAQYRISKTGWLRDDDHERVATISRRAAHITGFSTLSAEELQVVNYGIGGHYEPHFDFARLVEQGNFNKQQGNRIATVLFYLSDVAQGGATVFTELGIGVRPERGAALVWRNLHPSGEGDMATRHAACPVLQGSKWVSTKWFHQVGQEFVAPCSVEYQREGIARPLPTPVPAAHR